MMTFLKYTLLVILAFASVVQEVDVKKRKSLWLVVKEWWSAHPFRNIQFYVWLFISVMTVVVSAIDDRDAKKNQDELTKKIDSQGSSLKEQTRMISGQQEQIAAQTEILSEQQGLIKRQGQMISEQQTLMAEQQKSIGALVFTSPTSYAGKERFLRSFQDLARVAAIESNGTGFTGFVCDDGVAIYWYDTETETITGFHFFANAEINRILSGNPFAASCMDKDGNVTLASDSEIAIALRECLFRRLPPLSTNPVEATRTRDLILDEIKTLFRYVYRAETFSLTPYYFSDGKNAGLPSGKFDLSFSYVVNPCAAIWRTRSSMLGQIILSQNHLDSFHGMTMAEFSERVIQMMRTRGFEPNLGVKGIQIIAKRRQDAHATTASPFHFLRRKQ